jgi:tetratricopeptide (TPR) repeat protein
MRLREHLYRTLFISVFCLCVVNTVLMSQGEEDFYAKGLSSFENKKYSESVGYFSQFITKNPDSSDGYTARGNSYFMLEDFDNAIKDYNKSEVLGNESDSVLFMRAKSYIKIKKYNEAIEDLKSALEKNNKNISAFAELGNVYYFLGDFKNSQAAYSKSIVLNQTAEMYEKLAKVDLKLKLYNESIANMQKAILIDSSNVTYYNTLGIAYYYAKDTVSSYMAFKKALTIDSNYVYARYNMARYYYDIGSYELAVSDFSNVIKIDPPDLNDAEMYKFRGMTYTKLKDYNSALKDLEMSVKLNPEDADAVYTKGYVLLGLGNDTAALADFKKAIELDSNNAGGLMQVGYFAYKTGNYEQSIKLLRKSLQINPKDTNALFNLANVYFDMQKYSDAINYYNKAIEANSNFKQIYLNRGSSYYNLGFYRQAASDWENAIKYDPSIYNDIRPLLNDAQSKAGSKF